MIKEENIMMTNFLKTTVYVQDRRKWVGNFGKQKYVALMFGFPNNY